MGGGREETSLLPPGGRVSRFKPTLNSPLVYPPVLSLPPCGRRETEGGLAATQNTLPLSRPDLRSVNTDNRPLPYTELFIHQVSEDHIPLSSCTPLSFPSIRLAFIKALLWSHHSPLNIKGHKHFGYRNLTIYCKPEKHVSYDQKLIYNNVVYRLPSRTMSFIVKPTSNTISSVHTSSICVCTIHLCIPFTASCQSLPPLTSASTHTLSPDTPFTTCQCTHRASSLCTPLACNQLSQRPLRPKY